jgi:translation elongation factor EF-1alpha
MFKIGKVVNFYQKIGITIIELSGTLSVGDKIKVYKDGKCVLTQEIDEIAMNQKKIPFAKHGDVIALALLTDEKIQKGSEIFRLGELGSRS